MNIGILIKLENIHRLLSSKLYEYSLKGYKILAQPALPQVSLPANNANGAKRLWEK